jgi:hypothetical protein
MPRREIVKIINLTMKWCLHNFGPNKRKRYELTIACIKNTETDKECGQYCPEENLIEIYWNNLEDVREVIATCIHEWTHYKQPILTKYHKFTGPYCRNPFELEARKYEKKYTPLCWKDIKSKLNKQN